MAGLIEKPVVLLVVGDPNDFSDDWLYEAWPPSQIASFLICARVDTTKEQTKRKESRNFCFIYFGFWYRKYENEKGRIQ
jgi:hypothetical protein